MNRVSVHYRGKSLTARINEFLKTGDLNPRRATPKAVKPPEPIEEIPNDKLDWGYWRKTGIERPKGDTTDYRPSPVVRKVEGFDDD